MDPSLLMWGISTFITVSGYVAELCDDDPPRLQRAAYRAPWYRMGTMLNCGCERGFRRLNNFIRCAGNSSHASWENQCQCASTSSKGTGQGTPKPEEQKATQSQTPPVDEGNLPGHCREPPSWEHEDPKRIYHFVVGQVVHYQCVQGFRPLQRGSAESVCKNVSGKTQWTQPQLKCINASDNSGFSDDKDEPQASTHAPPGRDTSCALVTSTTDFHKHTEVATTMGSFLFTMEYQITVAGCMLLLISVLLLSGLTWQRRRYLTLRTAALESMKDQNSEFISHTHRKAPFSFPLDLLCHFPDSPGLPQSTPHLPPTSAIFPILMSTPQEDPEKTQTQLLPQTQSSYILEVAQIEESIRNAV